MNTFFKTVREIYQKFKDEESKDIFINRLLYSLFEDKKYIDEIVRRYVFEDGLNEKGAVRYLLYGIENAEDTKPIVVYGCGEMGAKIFEEIGEKIAYFCDRSKDRQSSGFCGKQVISLEELTEKKEEYQVIIGSIDYYFDIYRVLLKLGIKLVADNSMIVQKWLDVVNRQYFEKDIISYGENEIFIDGGCLNYATAKQFLRECSSAKMIYAFEPDSESAKRCKQEAANVDPHEYMIIEKGLYSKNTSLHFKNMGNGCSGIAEEGESVVEVCAIDQEIQVPVTFIKMDIEGVELEALKGAAETIRRYHPKLAVCVYHKPEDIVEIPKYILELNPKYKLYLRHYSDNAGETVLYAV